MSTGSLVTLTSYKYQANTFTSAATQITGSVCRLTAGFVMLHQLQQLYLGEPLIHWAQVLFASHTVFSDLNGMVCVLCGLMKLYDIWKMCICRNKTCLFLFGIFVISYKVLGVLCKNENYAFNINSISNYLAYKQCCKPCCANYQWRHKQQLMPQPQTSPYCASLAAKIQSSLSLLLLACCTVTFSKLQTWRIT